MTAAIDITAQQRKTLLAILRRFVPGIAVWAYGSRVKWTARPNSDLDLVAFTTPAQRGVVSELQDELAESNLPFLVDLHVWEEVPERFHEIIRKEYVVVQEAKEKQTGWAMASERKPARIGDYFDLIGGYAFKSSEFIESGIPVIKIKNVKANRMLYDVLSYVAPEFLQTRTDKVVQRGDLLITMSGNRFDGSPDTWVGKVAQFNEERPYLLNQRVGILRPKRGVEVERRFFSYSLSSEFYQNEFIAIATSSGGQANLSPSQILGAPIEVPPLAEQRGIAGVLGALDDKIELNRRMNATLEAMARALFQSWFVDFDPVHAKLDARQPAGLDNATAELFPEHFEHGEHGLLPIGWRHAAIEDVCAINAWTLGRNDDLETLEYVEISEVSRGNIANIATYTRGEEPSRARRRLHHGDTVLSTVRPDRGSYFLALNPPENRVASTGFAVLTPTKALWSFIHAAMTQPEVSDHLGQMADGGAYPAVRPEIIGAMKVAMPNESKILEAFHRTCAPLFEQAEANRTQSRTLASLRDTLLPKLLSGELSIEEECRAMKGKVNGQA